MSHDDYCSFTVVVKGKDLDLNHFKDPECWPTHIRVSAKRSHNRHV